MLKELFIQRLPPIVQMARTTASELNLVSLAQLAAMRNSAFSAIRKFYKFLDSDFSYACRNVAKQWLVNTEGFLVKKILHHHYSRAHSVTRKPRGKQHDVVDTAANPDRIYQCVSAVRLQLGFFRSTRFSEYSPTFPTICAALHTHTGQPLIGSRLSPSRLFFVQDSIRGLGFLVDAGVELIVLPTRAL